MTRTLLLSGGGDFTDPWHPFSETSARIAELLTELGHEVRTSDAVGLSLGQLSDSSARPDLLVINAGNAERASATDSAAIVGLADYLAAGLPLLVMHVASTAFPDEPAWEDIVGGRWVRGTTMHPDWAEGRVGVATDAHPITVDVNDFTVFDELYSYLRVRDGIVPLAWHDYEGVRHPLLWAHEVGSARIIYDALGHTAQSFDAPAHATLVQNSARWLLRES
ncbi:MAG: ThuA protein [Microbacteriaceae bacterium]|nr:ThuA protein [Microbacteriaceae bacterium]